MAEGFEAFHVPQQSRRDKLRVLAAHSHHHHHQDDGFPPPLYDPPPPPPSLVPSEFLSCAALLHHHQQPLGVVSDHDKTDKVASFDTNFHAPSLYMDPQLHLNQELSRNPFLFAPQNLRFLDADSFPGGGGGGEAMSVGGGPGGSGQGLSLTLSSHHHAHRSSSSSSQLPPLELNLQRYDASMQQQQQQTLGVSAGIHGGGDGDLSRGYCSSSVPSPAGGGGPFTGYASILKGSSSRFLRPAQQLLEEVCDVVRGTPIYPPDGDDDDDAVDDANDDARLESSAHDSAAALMEPPPTLHHLDDSQGVVNDGAGELKRKKSRLISILDEVYRRYRQYYQQLQAVIASFESVAGLNNAAPFANLALKAMSKHFRCLKDAITEQLQFAAKSQQGHMNNFEVEASPTADNLGKGFYNFQSAMARNMGLMEHPPVWRPQRGLPERAVTVLRAWLFDHFLHPYPTDTDKLMLAKQTGLSRNQVSNWFINARVRLWKPMVEEIHNLETRQAQKNSQKKEQSHKNQSEHSSMRNNTAVPCEDANGSAMHHHQVQDHHHHQQQTLLSSKRTRDEADGDNNSMGGRGDGAHEAAAMEMSASSYGGNMSRLGFGPTTAGGVSLTLGLHQNNELGLSGPADSSFPANAAQRFGLDATSSQGFVVSGFDAHSSQYGRGMIG
ncbi:unnamed protein product [Cuscuta campestris]|uniref:Homeobox domain-containing protein n=1 Tax=Cuscuta campestris TaxID=132261 RepID=A0A484MPY5_9ASTE|nr:unnamed protein product [Cuscuta campestris]